MDEKSLKYLKALKERGYSKEDAFAALDAQLSKNVSAPVEEKAAPEMEPSGIMDRSKEGIEKTAELYKSGKIGGVKAAIGVAGSVAQGALEEVGQKGMEGMADYVPYATPGAGKFTVNPEDPFAVKAAKMVGNIPGGIYNIAAGAANIGATAVEEAAGARAPGATGGALIGGLASIGSSALEKAGEVATVAEEKGSLQAISKASEIGSKLLAENPVEIASVKAEVPTQITKFAVNTAKALPKTGKFVVGTAKSGAKAAGETILSQKPETTAAIFRSPEGYEAVKKQGGYNAALVNIGEEIKTKIADDLSEKGQIGQIYEPIRATPVSIEQSVVESKIVNKLKNEGVTISAKDVSNPIKDIDVSKSKIGEKNKALVSDALNEVRSKLFKDGKLRDDLTGGDFHNVRKVLDDDYLDWDAPAKVGSAEHAVRSIRSAIDDLAKEYVPGLRELDAKFGPVAEGVKEVAREFLKKVPGGFELRQDYLTRILNSGSPRLLSDRMGILKKYIPDIESKLSMLKAVQDIENASQRFGMMHRGAAATAGGVIGGTIGTAFGLPGVGAGVGAFLANAVFNPSNFADIVAKAGYAARKMGIKLKSGNDALAASEKISRKLSKAQKLTDQEALEAAELLRAQSKIQYREKLAEEAKQENLYRTHPAYQESPLHPDFVSNQLKKAEKLKQEAEAYKKQYPVEATQVAKEVETPVLAQAKGQETMATGSPKEMPLKEDVQYFKPDEKVSETVKSELEKMSDLEVKRHFENFKKTAEEQFGIKDVSIGEDPTYLPKEIIAENTKNLAKKMESVLNSLSEIKKEIGFDIKLVNSKNGLKLQFDKNSYGGSYTRGEKMINIGDEGSIYHEYGHFLDHLSEQADSFEHPLSTHSVIEEASNTSMFKIANEKDDLAGKSYWSQPHEIFARAFDQYFRGEQKTLGIKIPESEFGSVKIAIKKWMEGVKDNLK